MSNPILGSRPRRIRPVAIELNLPDNIVIEVARSQQDLDQAYRLLHDAYVEFGYMESHPSGMRLNHYLALPDTRTLVVKYEGVVISTTTLVLDNPLGLPSDMAFNLSGVRKRLRNIVEVTGLAVAKEYRSQKSLSLMPLIKFLYLFSEVWYSSQALLISVNPRQKVFYSNTLLFDELAMPVVDNYEFAGGAPALAMCLDLTSYRERYHDHYCGRPLHTDLSAYFFRLRSAHFRLANGTDQVMTPKIFCELFMSKSDVFSELTDHQKLGLAYLYAQKGLFEFESIFGSYWPSSKFLRPSAHRQTV